MKGYKLLLIFVTLTTAVFAQSNNSWNKKVADLNFYLDCYARVFPFDEVTSMSYVGLSKADIQVLRQAENSEFITKDSIATFNMMEFLQSNIEEKLKDVVEDATFLTADVLSIIHEELAIVISPDKKLYNFSIDEKTGGTYRSRLSWMFFTEIGHLSMNQYEAEESKTYTYHIFEGDGFGSIDTIQTQNSTKYVLTSWVRGCSYCFETNVILVDWKEEKFNLDFYYSVNLRDWEKGVSYDSATKRIIVDYETDDLTDYCNCQEGKEEEAFNLNYDYGFEHLACGCIFEFNGETFELVKCSWEKIKD